MIARGAASFTVDGMDLSITDAFLPPPVADDTLLRRLINAEGTLLRTRGRMGCSSSSSSSVAPSGCMKWGFGCVAAAWSWVLGRGAVASDDSCDSCDSCGCPGSVGGAVYWFRFS